MKLGMNFRILLLFVFCFGSPAKSADLCSKVTIDFIRSVALSYGELDGGEFLSNGAFRYGSDGLVEFTGSLKNASSIGNLKIGFRLNSQCQIRWSEIRSRN